MHKLSRVLYLLHSCCITICTNSHVGFKELMKHA